MLFIVYKLYYFVSTFHDRHFCHSFRVKIVKLMSINYIYRCKDCSWSIRPQVFCPKESSALAQQKLGHIQQLQLRLPCRFLDLVLPAHCSSILSLLWPHSQTPSSLPFIKQGFTFVASVRWNA